MLDSIHQIREYTADLADAEEFFAKRMAFDATLMNFVLIGEMTDRISEELKERHAEIYWMKIKGFRNLIAHDYMGVDAEEVWQIVADYLYPFERDLKTLEELQQH